MALYSCKKDGCTDPNAMNYNSEAKANDGSCEYSKNSEDFDRVPMLANIADNLILPAYEELNQKITDLNTAYSAFQSNPNTSTLDALRIEWEATLMSWQHAGYYNFGPAETHFLRAVMNVYPTDSNQINGNIATGSYNLSSAINSDAKGLQALDYLLFGIGTSDSEILNKYTTDVNASARLTYVQDVIADMNNAASNVLNDWQASGGDYISTFKNSAGLDIGGSCNMLFNGFLQHYEKYIRSGKLGIPAGALTFSQTPLPSKVECYYNGTLSVQMLEEAMDELYNLYNGNSTNGDGIGFKEYLDYLETNGPSGLLSDDINNQILDAQNNISTTLTNPLSDFVVNSQSAALDVYDDMHLLVVYLKNDLKSAIGLSITYVDADGD